MSGSRANYFVPVLLPDGELVEGLVDVVPDVPELLGKVLLLVDPVLELLPEVSVELVPVPVELDPVELGEELLGMLLPLLLLEPELLVSPDVPYVGEEGVLKPELPVPDVEPDVPESLEVPLVPPVPPDPDPDASLLEPDVPEEPDGLDVPDEPDVPDESDDPEEPEDPDDPEDEPPWAGVLTVVVVVVTAAPLLPDDAPEFEPEDALLLLEGSAVVVVVVVLWEKLAVAVPINDKNMARGNFFMPAPLWMLSEGIPELRKG